jgi:hypothetical protein
MTGLNLNTSPGNWISDPPPEQEPLIPETTHKKKSAVLSRNNLVLAGLFAAGIVVIALLHFKAGPKSAQAASAANDTQMDTLLATLTQVKKDCRSAAADSIINRFYYEAKQRQVPPGQLAGNPFHLVLPDPPPEPSPSENTAPAAAADPQAEALAEAQESIRDLTLQSVLTGSAGATAIVSNNVLTVGQNVCGWTVVEIAPRRVVLQWKSHRHILTMK